MSINTLSEFPSWRQPAPEARMRLYFVDNTWVDFTIKQIGSFVDAVNVIRSQGMLVTPIAYIPAHLIKMLVMVNPDGTPAVGINSGIPVPTAPGSETPQ